MIGPVAVTKAFDETLVAIPDAGWADRRGARVGERGAVVCHLVRSTDT